MKTLFMKSKRERQRLRVTQEQNVRSDTFILWCTRFSAKPSWTVLCVSISGAVGKSRSTLSSASESSSEHPWSTSPFTSGLGELALPLPTWSSGGVNKPQNTHILRKWPLVQAMYDIKTYQRRGQARCLRHQHPPIPQHVLLRRLFHHRRLAPLQRKAGFWSNLANLEKMDGQVQCCLFLHYKNFKNLNTFKSLES